MTGTAVASASSSSSSPSSSLLSNLVATAATTALTAAIAYGTYQYVTYSTRWWWAKRQADPQKREVHHQSNWQHHLIHGSVAPGWERIRDEFVYNFQVRGELGAAVCVYHRGQKVVDLWGGYADRETSRPWQHDTVVPIFSSTKGISGIALYMLASKGQMDLNARVSEYWPEFAQHGKEDVTIMDLLDHGVGLAGISPPLTLEMLQHPNSQQIVRDQLAAAEMEWSNAGDRKGYMAVNLGFYESALVQLVDASHSAENSRRQEGRTIGQYLSDEAFAPLGVADEIYIGLPESVPSSRIATIDGMKGLEPLWNTGAYPEGFMRKLLTQPNSYTGRAFRNPQLSAQPSVVDYNRREVQAVEMPASGGLATARAVAQIYNAAERAINRGGDAEDANPLGLDRSILKACLMRPATPGRSNVWIDEVLGIEACMGGGMLLPAPPELRGTVDGLLDGGNRFFCAPGNSSFGTPGAGGSFCFCDPDAEIAYAYVMNRCGQLIADDPREFALRDKVYEAVENIRMAEQNSGEGGATYCPPSPGGLLVFNRSLNVPHYLAKRYMDAYPELAPLP